MRKGKARLLWIGMLAFSSAVLQAQSPQDMIQQVVNTERTANQNDHTHWIYLDEARKPKEHTLQWIAGSQQGDVRRLLERNEQGLPEPQQRESIEKFLHDPKAQNKLAAENQHDDRQVDDLLKLLPAAFVWTQTGASATTTTLHFDPDPRFHPPTREARVFSSMTGDLVFDNDQRRIRSMRGRLIRDVTFGGGLLGKLKEGSSFSLAQEQVGPSLWQLTAIDVHLEGNALLFKSVSLQQVEQRSRFTLEPSLITLDQAAGAVMNQPSVVSPQDKAGLKVN